MRKRLSEKSPYLGAVSEETAGRVKQVAPSAERNTGPILNVLAGILPSAGQVLEIASGTGQHVVSFAQAHPGVEWTPSDPDPLARASIAAWIAESGVNNVRQPADLDVTEPNWNTTIGGPYSGIVSINLLHISPWQACQGLMAGAEQLLEPNGLLYFYGPFMRDGAHTAPSNKEFDRSLRHRNPNWGVRDSNDVVACANKHRFVLDRMVEMPANNLSLILRLPG
ncbi:MAG: DUF938 domain-containing protein [Acidiferrobacterales bacterium]